MHFGTSPQAPPPARELASDPPQDTKYLTKVVFMPERNGGYWSDKGYEWYAGM